MLVPENWGNLVDPVIRKVFFTTLEKTKKEDDMIPTLCRVEKSSRQIERVLGVGGLSDVPEFTGQFTADDPAQQYLKTFTHTEYGKKLVVQKRLLEDDLHRIIKQYPEQLAIALHRTQQKLLANVFNNAFTGTSGGDSLSLCNNAHTSASADGVNQDNLQTTALTYANLISSINLMNQFKDDRGELMHCIPDTILVPLGLRQTALEIVGSDKEPYTMDNTVNVARDTIGGGRLKVIVWNRLTDSNNWFLIDSKMMKQHLWWFNRVGPELDKDKDFDHRSAQWSIYWRGSVGFSDWRWIMGHQVA